MQATRRGFSRFASRRNLVEQSVRTLSWVGSSKDDITKLITVPLVDTSLRRVVSIPSPLFLLPRSQRYVSTETQPMSSNGDRKADSPSQNQPASSENEDSKKPMPEEHEETKYEIDEEALLERQIKKQIQETEEKQKEQNTKQLFKSKRMMALFAAGAVSISVLMKILFDYKSSFGFQNVYLIDVLSSPFLRGDGLKRFFGLVQEESKDDPAALIPPLAPSYANELTRIYSSRLHGHLLQKHLEGVAQKQNMIDKRRTSNAAKTALEMVESSGHPVPGGGLPAWMNAVFRSLGYGDIGPNLAEMQLELGKLRISPECAARVMKRYDQEMRQAILEQAYECIPSFRKNNPNYADVDDKTIAEAIANPILSSFSVDHYARGQRIMGMTSHLRPIEVTTYLQGIPPQHHNMSLSPTTSTLPQPPRTSSSSPLNGSSPTTSSTSMNTSLAHGQARNGLILNREPLYLFEFELRFHMHHYHIWALERMKQRVAQIQPYSDEARGSKDIHAHQQDSHQPVGLKPSTSDMTDNALPKEGLNVCELDGETNTEGSVVDEGEISQVLLARSRNVNSGDGHTEDDPMKAIPEKTSTTLPIITSSSTTTRTTSTTGASGQSVIPVIRHSRESLSSKALSQAMEDMEVEKLQEKLEQVKRERERTNVARIAEGR